MSTSSYVRDTTIDEVHNTQCIVVRRVRSKTGALTFGQDCVNIVTPQVRTTLERVAEAGIELVSTVTACDWQPLCQSIHMLLCSSICIFNCCDV